MRKRVAVLAKPNREAAREVRSLVRWLARRGIEPVVDERAADLARGAVETFSLTKPPADVHLMIVLGGDGTLLSAARAMGARQVPILGVNLGSLGFLTDVALAHIYPTLEQVLAGNFVTHRRAMLDGEIVRKGARLSRHTVLNDVVITKGAMARMIEIGVDVDEQFVALLRADGIIASTPTGSTAYSLAAGGPILHPRLEAIILTPICPHTLTYRPVVIPDQARIELTLRGTPDEVFASFDGQASEKLEPGDVVRVRKSRSTVKLVSLPDQNYFQVLRHKLRWAERPRSRAH